RPPVLPRHLAPAYRVDPPPLAAAPRPNAGAAEDPERPRDHRPRGVDADIAAAPHQTAGHCLRDAASTVAVDQEFTASHTGRDAMHIRERAYNPHAVRPFAFHIEEVTQLRLTSAQPRRQCGNLAFRQTGDAIGRETFDPQRLADRRTP